MRVAIAALLIAGCARHLAPAPMLGRCPADPAPPSHGTWTSGPPALHPRLEAALVGLAGGGVLLAGGYQITGTRIRERVCTTDVERFDPATLTWRDAAPMATPRCTPIAAALPDGRVLVVGSAVDDSVAPMVPTAELYDPRTDRWSPTAFAAIALAPRHVAVLADGRVALVGRTTGDRDVLVLWDETGGAVLTPPEPFSGSWFVRGIAVAADGALLVISGGARVARWDPATGAWSDHRGDYVVVEGVLALPDGPVIYGMQGWRRWDAATATWTEMPSPGMSEAVTAAVLADGRVLAVTPPLYSGSAVFTPATARWERVGSPGQPPRRLHPLPDGRVISIGQSGETSLWDPSAEPDLIWRRVGPGVIAPGDATVTELADGRLLIAGGTLYDGSSARSVVLDPRTGAVTETGALHVARSQYAAVRLSDGRVLAVGHHEPLPSRSQVVELELWDPATGQWSRVGTLGRPLRDVAAALLPDGRVVIAGSHPTPYPKRGPIERHTEIWRFDPAQRRVEPIGLIDGDRRAMALFAGERLAIIGGQVEQGDEPITTTNVTIVDLVTRAATPGPPLREHRLAAVAIAVDDGVLIAGGWQLGAARALLGGPGAELWRPGGTEPLPFPFPEMGSPQAIVRLPDGRIAVADCARTAALDVATRRWTMADDRPFAEVRTGCRIMPYRDHLLAFDDAGCMSELIVRAPR